MKWLKSILREIFGLFVDEPSFAITILLWLALVILLLPFLGWLPRFRALLLFAGLVAILSGSAIRYARSKRL